METVKVTLILVLLVSEVCSADTRSAEKCLRSAEIQDVLVRMVRNPGPRHYLGLMEKKGLGASANARKRHRFQTFVGLMGRRRSLEENEPPYSSQD